MLRVAALVHDIGHLPFSHAAEDALLPVGWNHEKLTRAMIESDEMQRLWQETPLKLHATDVVKVALGKKKAPDLAFSTWETVLAELITGDAFGVDRVDYLLRDAHHTGVGYGKFDHYRLGDTLRILEQPREGRQGRPGGC